MPEPNVVSQDYMAEMLAFDVDKDSVSILRVWCSELSISDNFSREMPSQPGVLRGGNEIAS